MNAQGESTWLLLGDKSGDNAQLRSLAAALGVEAQGKHIDVNRLYRVPNLVLGSRLPSLWAQTREQLAGPPWPDLVLAAGRRSVPAARFIRRRSGGRAVLVHVGRPWAPLSWFDLVVSPRHYGLPEHPNVMHVELPLNRLPAAAAGGAASHIVVLLGGCSSEVRFDENFVASLAGQLRAFTSVSGRPLTLVASRRTPPSARRLLEQALPSPHRVLPHDAGSSRAQLAALVADAELLIVTGDSASMLAEAVYSGQPTLVVPVPPKAAFRKVQASLLSCLLPPALNRSLRAAGLVIAPRALGRTIHDLQSRGVVGSLDPLRLPSAQLADELPAVVERIHALLAQRRAGG